MIQKIPNGSLLELNAENSGNVRRLRVNKWLGQGATCIAYEVTDTDTSLRYVLKECCPARKTFRQQDLTVCWKDDSEESEKQCFREAWEKQRDILQNDEALSTNNALAEGILTGYGTVYSLAMLTGAKTYDKVEDATFQDTCTTMRALTKAVWIYHKNGMLHLDLKPQNILVDPEKRDTVIMLDFGSVVNMDDIKRNGVTYTLNYAAPELARREIAHICPATDIYSIGAILFERIYGRVPDCFDRKPYADWEDMDQQHGMEKLSRKALRLTKEVLHKTLSAALTGVNKRIPNCGELLPYLDELIKEADPDKNQLLMHLPESMNSFVGRWSEIQTIHQLFQNGTKVVFLEGMGGIGKTELALQYAWEHKACYDVICFGCYKGSVVDMLADRSFIDFRKPGEPTDITHLQSHLDEHTLLIIDGYDTKDKKGFRDLCSLNARILVTTRLSADLQTGREEQKTIAHINVDKLGTEQQEQLFYLEAQMDEPVTAEDQAAVHSILQTIEGYTMLIPLIARQYKRGRGRQTLPQIADGIREAGLKTIDRWKVEFHKTNTKGTSEDDFEGTAYHILNQVMDMAQFSEEEVYVLQSLMVLGRRTINFNALLDLIGDDLLDALNDLIDQNWVECRVIEGDHIVSLHDVIRMLVREKYSVTVKSLPWVEKLLRQKSKEIAEFADKTFHGEHTAQSTGDEYNASDDSADPALFIRREHFHLKETRYDYEWESTVFDYRLCESIIHELDLNDKPTARAVLAYYGSICTELSAVLNFSDNGEAEARTILETHSNLTARDKYTACRIIMFNKLRFLIAQDAPIDQLDVVYHYDLAQEKRRLHTAQEIDEAVDGFRQMAEDILNSSKKGKKEKEYQQALLAVLMAGIYAGCRYSRELFLTDSGNIEAHNVSVYSEVIDKLYRALENNTTVRVPYKVFHDVQSEAMYKNEYQIYKEFGVWSEREIVDALKNQEFLRIINTSPDSMCFNSKPACLDAQIYFDEGYLVLELVKQMDALGLDRFCCAKGRPGAIHEEDIRSIITLRRALRKHYHSLQQAQGIFPYENFAPFIKEAELSLALSGAYISCLNREWTKAKAFFLFIQDLGIPSLASAYLILEANGYGEEAEKWSEEVFENQLTPLTGNTMDEESKLNSLNQLGKYVIRTGNKKLNDEVQAFLKKTGFRGIAEK